MIDVIQRDIFRLGTWYSESLGRVNSHEEMLSDRADEVRQLWQAFERHTRFTEQIERETYWMHVYTKQVMLMRAADLALLGSGAAVDDEDEGEEDGDGSDSDTAASSVCTGSTLVTPIQPHIALDNIVVCMMEDAMPDELKKVRNGFEVVHGSSAFIHGKHNAQALEDESDEDGEILHEDSDDGSMLV